MVRVTQLISHNPQPISLIGKSNMDEFLNSALDGIPSLSNTYFAIFALGCQICPAILGPSYIYIWRLLAQVIFVGTKEATENSAC